MSSSLPLYRAESVRAVERAAASRGLDASTLMVRAGAAVAALARARWPGVRRIGVLCGRGNNGGDGYVAALALHRAGLDVSLLAAGPPATPEADHAAGAWRVAGQGVVAPGERLPQVELWIDALFGVGLTRDVAGPMAETLRGIQAQGVPVLAIDVPSGIDANSGAVRGHALRADLTLCLVGAKRGLFTAAGREAAGEVLVDSLDVPTECFAEVPADALGVAAPALHAALPIRGIDSHKGRHGRVLCVGGDDAMEGALVLCAEAAARAGAGSVMAWTRPGAAAALHARRPEVMARALASVGGRADDRDAIREALAATAANVIACGPGLGRGAWARALFAATLDSAGEGAIAPSSAVPPALAPALVLDADALGLLAEARRELPGAVLTPHPGEAARLLGWTTARVQADRFAALEALVSRYRCAVVLKGAGTLVGAPGETPRVLRAGNPGMASAGMGDVLCGVVAALRAQGLGAFDAAWMGALAHSAAGDVAAGRRPRGLLAADLMDALREVLNP